MTARTLLWQQAIGFHAVNRALGSQACAYIEFKCCHSNTNGCHGRTLVVMATFIWLGSQVTSVRLFQNTALCRLSMSIVLLARGCPGNVSSCSLIAVRIVVQ